MRQSRNLFPNFAYKSRAVPIRMAKRQGPSRSPSVLLTPSPLSAKVDAHWLMDCSAAPESAISATNSQNVGERTSFFTGMLSPSAAGEGTGTNANKMAFKRGRHAQMRHKILQCSEPNAAKNAVEKATTAADPQQ